MDETIPARIPVEIERALAATDEVRALIGELDRELSANYAAEQRHGLALDAIFQPHVRFFVARIRGSPVGCGGVALFSDFAEIKRMYVRSEARGHGVADTIIARLAAEASDAGLTVLRLETGMHQIAAIRFYRRCGFQPCGVFEPYSSMPPQAITTSIFLEKRLSPS
ncbi:MAG: GNAT family N-acetyltransferase [Alphaproteobacteria bacterium]